MRLLLGIVLLVPALWAAGIKLILKDGSYQIVRSYEIKDDRVIFFSLERNLWEEMPASLVDWKATEEAKRTANQENLEKAREVIREAAAEPKPGEGLEVVPGVRLPDEWGAYALVNDGVVTLPASAAAARADTRRAAVSILLPVPVLRNRKLVTLAGVKAKTQLDGAPEALFVSGKASDTSRFALLRVTVKDGARELEAILLPLIRGKAQHQGNQVEVTQEALDKDTTKLVPRFPLPAGEYAIVEFLDDKLNLYVWDFGVK
jgi:hypothetical protein